jgi:transposase
MQIQQIIGADLSKKTIDLVCHLTKMHMQIQNNIAGFKDMVKWLKQQSINPAEVMIVMEHTGLYSYCFENYLHQHHIAFTKVNALTIKRSAGLVRGKNDKIDAKRIASYGYEKKDQLQQQQVVEKDLQRLQLLHSTRARLVKQRAATSCAIKEYRNIRIPENDILMRSQLQIITAFDKQIEKLDNEISAVVKINEPLNKNFKLLVSIKGVGKVLALNTIVKTNNFTKFSDARKFACYCGTAPFEHTSGSSIKGKTRVSHLADKQMKTLLDLSAKSAIQYDRELREFYIRRLDLGKSKMSTINIVRNKILYRMFAVVKRQTAFKDNYLQAA